MTELSVSDRDGKKVEGVSVSDSFMGFKPNKQAIHDYVVMYMHNRRSWTASTKTRAEVRSSGKKPWRQKGTGRARAGSLVTNIFRGGGTVFAPKPKSVYYNLPKRVRRLAFKSAVADRLQNSRVFVVDDLKMERPSTREVARILKNMKVEGKTLVVLNEPGNSEVLSMRNLPEVTLRRTDNVNAYDVLSNTNLVLTRESFGSLLEMVGDEGSA